MAKKILFLLSLTFLLLMSHEAAYAAEKIYYISPSGSDVNSGSNESPFATFSKAFSVMSGGDTLIVKNGVYNQRIANPPSGMPDNYTIVKAENDGVALLDSGESSVIDIETNYIQIEGFDARTTSKSDSIISIRGGHHIKLLRTSAFRKGGISSYPSGISINADYVLLEDCAVAGGARYVVAVGNSSGNANNIIIRRCVIRWDYQGSGSPPARGGFMVYGPKEGTGTVSNISFQNVIVLDTNDASGFSTDGGYENLDVYGSIALNINGDGFSGSMGQGAQRKYSQNIAWNTTGYGFKINGLTGIIDQATVGKTKGIYSWNGGGVLNSLLIDNNYKFDVHPFYNYNWFYNNVPPPIGTNYITANPDLKYIIQTTDTGTGESGKKRGAVIEKKYGVSGTLRGDAGWNFLTNEKLWPWPHEERWKKIICQENPAPSGSFPSVNDWNRGFCKSGSLTKYVWEYLGNPIPADIYGGNIPPPTKTDTESPSVSITNPLNNSEISGNINISVLAADNIGIAGVQFKIDNINIGAEDTLSPFSVILDTNNFSNSSHILTAVARDAAGNIAASERIIVNINNQIISTPPPLDNFCSDINILCVDDTQGPFQEYANIQQAADAVKPGNIVYVYDGVYSGFQVSVSGTKISPISFIAKGENVIIDKGGITGDGTRIQNASYIKVEGFKIKDISGRCVAARGATPVLPMQEIIVKNNTCDNSGMEGFYLSEIANSLIENNTIKNSGTASVSKGNHGIYLANAGSDNTVIRGNIVSGAKGIGSEGIHINGDLSIGGDGIISNLLIENNTVFDNSTNGFNFDGMQDSIIQNNLVYGNGRHALRGYKGDGADGPKNLKIINNTFLAKTGGWAIKLSEDLGGHKIFNNILFSDSFSEGSISVSNANFTSNYNFLTDRFSVDNGITIIDLIKFKLLGYDGNSFLSSPADTFVNLSLNDYHLKNGSFAVDNGISSTFDIVFPSYDISGVYRPQGLKHDIGAYEFLNANVPDLTPPLILSAGPSGMLPAGSGKTAISVTTNEKSICKYSAVPNTPYAAMVKTFEMTGDIEHEELILGLLDGASYDFYVKCADLFNNQSASDYKISFLVASAVSDKFKAGDIIKTVSNLNIRSGPGISETILGIQAMGSEGFITEGPIIADGYKWWKIDYINAPDGWSAEDWIIKAAVSLPVTYYISLSGSDLNSGKFSFPFQTFKYAFSKMKGGDILIIKSGIYNQDFGEFEFINGVKVPVSFPPNGTEEKYTIIKARNAAVNNIQITGVSYIKIDGLRSQGKVNIEGSNLILGR